MHFFESRRSLRVLTCALLACQLGSLLAPALAGPEGGVIAAGSAAITSAAGLTRVTQQTDRAIVNWHSFSTTAGETVRFEQPSASAVTLNRVTGVAASQLDGALTANGRVFLLNPNGVVFGRGAQVNVGGLVASTLSMSDQDFLRGHHELKAGEKLTAVVNQGTIKAAPGGAVALVGPVVSNQGTIEAPAGRVTLAAGTHALVNLDGAGLVSLMPSTGAARDVTLPANTLTAALASVVNNSHIVEAGSVKTTGGVVTLGGAEGVALNEGRISADGRAGVNAGQVRVDSTRASVLAPGSAITADGHGAHSSGGTARLISRGTSLAASGSSLSAHAGTSGDGGLVEVSGKKFSLKGKVDVSAPGGQAGSVLIDPTDVFIVDGSAGAGDLDASFTGSPDSTLASGSSDIAGDTLTVGQINSLLANGNVTIEATNSIQLQSTSGNDITDAGLGRTLTLHAFGTGGIFSPDNATHGGITVHNLTLNAGNGFIDVNDDGNNTGVPINGDGTGVHQYLAAGDIKVGNAQNFGGTLTMVSTAGNIFTGLSGFMAAQDLNLTAAGDIRSLAGQMTISVGGTVTLDNSAVADRPILISYINAGNGTPASFIVRQQVNTSGSALLNIVDATGSPNSVLTRTTGQLSGSAFAVDGRRLTLTNTGTAGETVNGLSAGSLSIDAGAGGLGITGTVAATDTSGGDLILQAGAGGISLGGAASATRSASLLASAGGSVGDTGAGSVTAASVLVQVAGAATIGASGLPVHVTAPSLSLVNGTGDVDVTYAGASVALHSGTLAVGTGSGALSLDTQAPILTVGTVGGVSALTLTAGAIEGSAGTAVAGSIVLNASTGVGATTPVKVDAGTLTATTGTGAVQLQSANAAPTVIDVISFGTGDVSLTSTGAGALFLQGSFEAFNGNANLVHTGNLDLRGHVQVHNAANSVLVQSTAGDIHLIGDGGSAPTIEAPVGGTGTISVFAAGNVIGDGVADATQLDVRGTNVLLRAGPAGTLGTGAAPASRLEIDARTLTITDAAGTGNGAASAFISVFGGPLDLQAVRAGALVDLQLTDDVGAPNLRDTGGASGIFAPAVRLAVFGTATPGSIGGGAGGPLDINGASAINATIADDAGGAIDLRNVAAAPATALLEVRNRALAFGPAGNITYAQTGGVPLAVTSARTDNGSVTISTGGALNLAGTVRAGGGVAHLTGTGIAQSAGTVSAPVLRLDSSGSVGLVGTPILASTGSLSGTAGGAFAVATDQALTLGAVTLAGPGAGVDVSTTSGDLTLSGVVSAASAPVRLATTGQIVSLNAGQDITATALTLTSGTGVGAGKDLLTTATSLTASAPGGAIRVVNTGALALNTIAAGGVVSIEAQSGAISGGTVSGGSLVHLRADTGSITLGTVTATGEVRLEALGGSIVDGNGAARDVTAATLTLNALDAGTAGVDPLEVDVNSVTGSAIQQIALTDPNAITLTQLAAGTNLTVIAGGDITVDRTSATSTINLQTSGSIVHGSPALTADLASAGLVLSATGGIGSVATPIVVTAPSITVTSPGVVELGALGNATLASVTASGNFGFASGANLTLGAISGGVVDLRAAGDIVDDGSAATVVSAATLDLAGNSAGAIGQPLGISAGTLNATLTGLLRVNDSGAVALNSVTAGGVIVSAGGAITVGNVNAGAGAVALNASAIQDSGARQPIRGASIQLTASSIGTLADPVSTQGGPVSVTATGGDAFLTLSSGQLLATLNVAGNAGIDSPGSLALGGGVVGGSLNLNAAGALTDDGNPATVLAAQGTTINALSIGAPGAPLQLDATALTAVASGGSLFIADPNSLTLLGAQASTPGAVVSVLAQQNLTVQTASADSVFLTAATGTISDDGAVNPGIVASTVSLQASGRIGSSVSPIDVTATRLTANSGSSDIILRAHGDLELTDLQAQAPGAQVRVSATPFLTASGSLQVDHVAAGSLAQLTASGDLEGPPESSLSTVFAPSVLLNANNVGVFGTFVVDAPTRLQVSVLGRANLGLAGSTASLIVVQNPQAVNQPLTVFSQGNLAVSQVIGTSTVSLEALGTITNAGGETPRVVAPNVSIAGDAGVGTATSPLFIDGGTATLSSLNGSVFVSDPNDLSILHGTVLGANTTFSALASGSLSVDDILSAGLLRLTAVNGSITDAATSPHSMAAQVAELHSGTGIGSAANPLNLEASTVTGASGAGAFLDSHGSVLVDGFRSGGDLSVRSLTGNVQVAGVQAAGRAQLQAGNGSVLSGGGAAFDLRAPSAAIFAAGEAGVAASPIAVDITGGSLVVLARAAIDGISGAFRGNINGGRLVSIGGTAGTLLLNGSAVVAGRINTVLGAFRLDPALAAAIFGPEKAALAARAFATKDRALARSLIRDGLGNGFGTSAPLTGAALHAAGAEADGFFPAAVVAPAPAPAPVVAVAVAPAPVAPIVPAAAAPSAADASAAFVANVGGTGVNLSALLAAQFGGGLGGGLSGGLAGAGFGGGAFGGGPGGSLSAQLAVASPGSFGGTASAAPASSSDVSSAFAGLGGTGSVNGLSGFGGVGGLSGFGGVGGLSGFGGFGGLSGFGGLGSFGGFASLGGAGSAFSGGTSPGGGVSGFGGFGGFGTLGLFNSPALAGLGGTGVSAASTALSDAIASGTLGGSGATFSAPVLPPDLGGTAGTGFVGNLGGGVVNAAPR